MNQPRGNLQLMRNILGKTREAWRLIFRYPELNLVEVNYDDYWRSKRGASMGALSDFQKARCDLILPLLEEGSTVLDLGCGDGSVLLHLLRHKKFHPIGVDSSEVALDFLRGQGIEVLRMDLSSLDSLDALPATDFILACEVLEHLQNPERCLQALCAKARKGIIFTIPNTGYFPYRIRMLLGRSVMQWRLHPGEHLRFWTLADLRWWLRALNFAENAEIRCYEGMPFLNRVLPSVFAMGLLAFIRKREGTPSDGER